MKRLFVFIFFALLSCTACANKDQMIMSQDMDPRFAGQLIDTAESETAYYWRNAPFGQFIYYYDKATSTSAVLCRRPECNHSDAGECDGYLGADLRPSLVCIGDRLYWIARRQKPDKTYTFSLYSMRTDSSDRRLMHDIDLPEETNPQRFDIHRESIYIYSVFQKVDNADPIIVTTLLRVPLNGGKASVIARYETSAAEAPFITARFYGEAVYYLLCINTGDGETANRILRYDYASQLCECIYTAKGQSIRDFALDHEGCLLISYAAEGNKQACVYRITEGVTVPAMFFLDDSFSGKVIRFSDNIVIGESYPNNDIVPTLWIQTFDGNTLFRGKLPAAFLDLVGSPITGIYPHAVCGDKHAIFFDCEVGIADSDPLSGWPRLLIRYEITERGLSEKLLCSENLSEPNG